MLDSYALNEINTVQKVVDNAADNIKRFTNAEGEPIHIEESTLTAFNNLLTDALTYLNSLIP